MGLASSRATQAKEGQIFGVKLWPNPSWVILGFIEERLGLISHYFLSSGKGPSSRSFQATTHFWASTAQYLGSVAAVLKEGVSFAFLGFASLPRASPGALIPAPICTPLSINKKSTQRSFWVSICGLIACYCFMVFLSILICIFTINFP